MHYPILCDIIQHINIIKQRRINGRSPNRFKIYPKIYGTKQPFSSSFSKICKIDIISFKNILKNKIDKIKEDEIKKIAKFMKCSIEEIIIELNSRY